MEQKLLEIRDKGTTIKALAMKLTNSTPREQRILAAAGFGDEENQSHYVLLANIDGGQFKMTYDQFGHGAARTMREAHHFLHRHWNEIQSGALIDVQYILGETSEPKQTEFGAHYDYSD